HPHLLRAPHAPVLTTSDGSALSLPVLSPASVCQRVHPSSASRLSFFAQPSNFCFPFPISIRTSAPPSDRPSSPFAPAHNTRSLPRWQPGLPRYKRSGDPSPPRRTIRLTTPASMQVRRPFPGQSPPTTASLLLPSRSAARPFFGPQAPCGFQFPAFDWTPGRKGRHKHR